MIHQVFSMNKLKKLSNRKLTKILHESDNMIVAEEIARRINLGIIPLAIINFHLLSNKKLRRILTLTNCDWAINELGKRMNDGRIPTRVVTLEEIREEYRQAKLKYNSKEEKKVS